VTVALVVDDDAAVRRCIQRILGRTCEVLQAESCETALAVLEDAAEAVDVVVLDLSFPEGALQGDDAFGRIRDRWPGLPVVIVTGARDDVATALSFGGRGPLHFVSKFSNLALALPAAVAQAGAIARARPPAWRRGNGGSRRGT
jgi:DNA-binding NtrC family response regulator